MRKRKLNKALLLAVLMAMLIARISGCAQISSTLNTLKGELFGNNYTIWEYDNFGDRIMTLHGDKITIDGGVDESGEASSYIDITIDGYEWNHVGNTLVFAQNGVDMITDFQIPDEINSDGVSTGLMGVDRVINSYRNSFGKKSVIIVFSQTGAPICMFQGDLVYTEVPDDLPKTTLLNIDGKRVYLHRANIDIIPTQLFDN